MRATTRFTRISAASTALAGVLLTQACGGQTPSAAPPTGAPPASAAASASAEPGATSSAGSKPSTAPPATSAATSKKPTSKSTAGGVFSGTREVWLLPPATEGTLAVSSSRKVELSDHFDKSALFVLTKVDGERYWIRTARLRTGGEPYCLQAETSGMVTAAACDAAKDSQLFLFRKTGETNGKPEYTIRTTKDVYVIVTDEGGVRAVPIGEGTPDIDTPFTLPDRGKASMPALD